MNIISLNISNIFLNLYTCIRMMQSNPVMFSRQTVYGRKREKNTAASPIRKTILCIGMPIPEDKSEAWLTKVEEKTQQPA